MDKLNIKDAAEYIGLSEKTLRRWIKKGKVKPETEDGEYRFSKSDLEPFRPATQKRLAAEQGIEKKTETRQQHEPTTATKNAKAAPDTTKILIDSLTSTMAVLKDQLAIKDKQMEAKDTQILKLMDAQERSDILLKSIQDRVRQLEAPGSRPQPDYYEPERDIDRQKNEKQDSGLDTGEDVQADVQSNVHPKKQDVQSNEQGSQGRQDTVDGEYEDAKLSPLADVQAPESETVQPEDTQDNTSSREQGSEKFKKGLFRRLFSRN